MSRMEHDGAALRTGGSSARGMWLVAILCVAQACGTALDSPSRKVDETPERGAQALHQPGWHAYPSTARDRHAAVALPQGRALVCGGMDSRSIPVVYPRSCELLSVDESLGLVTQPFAPLPEDRTQATLSLLSDGRVLIAGGRDAGGSGLQSAHVGTFASGWGAPELLVAGRGLHTASVLEDLVVLIGGQTGSSIVSPVEVRSSEGSWSAALEQPRSGHTATVLRSGTELLVVGGYANGDYLRSAALFSADAGWREVAPMPVERFHHTATLLEDGAV
ncbi:MAG TPA: kelch repeat-containing protein, partial [Polyangiaceae bacterium]|nr:kelch repeat-containing protein [Polyangiaceae bacterium]